jgi:HEAT repeat protein
VPELVKHVSHEDAEVRKSVIAAIVPLVNEQNRDVAVAPLKEALNDALPEVKRNAAIALGNIGGKDAAAAVPVLVNILQTDDIEYRRQAAAVLGNIGEAAKDAAPALREALTTGKDAALRTNAAAGLGGIKDGSENTVSALVSVLSNRSEDKGVRRQAAFALLNIGSTASTEKAIPQVLNVVTNAQDSGEIRFCALLSMHPHGQKLVDRSEFLKALENLVANEPKGGESKMLRYDAAYLLAVIKQEEASAPTMKTLQEFLEDENIQQFAGTAREGAGGGDEKKAGGAKVGQKGRGDGRTMVIQALTSVGEAKVRGEQGIVKQLQKLANGARTDPTLKDQSKKLLSEFGL